MDWRDLGAPADEDRGRSPVEDLGVVASHAAVATAPATAGGTDLPRAPTTARALSCNSRHSTRLDRRADEPGPRGAPEPLDTVRRRAHTGWTGGIIRCAPRTLTPS